MYSIFYHELQSYRTQLDEIRFQKKNSDSDIIENLTHSSLARTNRLNFMVVGLCGLAEAFLYETAERHTEFDNSKVLSPDSGFNEIKKFLSDEEVVDFSRLNNWDKFMSVRKIRHKIVHGYGGLIVESFDSKFKNHFNKLGLNLRKYLIADRRIRFNDSAISLRENTRNEYKRIINK